MIRSFYFRAFAICLSLFPSLVTSAAEVTAEPVFRFHLFVESQGLDPQVTHSASGDYLFHLLYRGLFTFKRGVGLRPHGALACVTKAKSLRCDLDPKRKWSNGAVVTAADYVTSFRRLIDPKNASPQASSLFSLVNARQIQAGQLPSTTLGIRAEGPRKLVLEFAEADPEFKYKLTHPALSPYPPGGFPDRNQAQLLITNGPYQVSFWKRESMVRFKANKYYVANKIGENPRPAVEAWFVDEDATALRLYEAGKLDFLRRLVAREVPRFKGTPEFYQIPMARFDYLGFGPDLASRPELRDALVHGVDFAQFLTLFDTLTPPGCPSLPLRLMDQKVCQTFSPARATPLGARLKTVGKRPLTFEFSRMGGEDIARAAEWFQGQWRKNVGVAVDLHPREQGSYIASLKLRPPAIFRKGVALDRPTCMAALEIFTRGHPENYIHFDDAEYDRLTARAGQADLGEAEQKSACTAAVKRLLQSNRVIPLGEMFFTVLAKSTFKGWELNELNQLDLSELEAASR